MKTLKWLWLRSWFWLTIGSAIFAVLYQANDNLIMHDKIVYSPAPFLARSFYLMVGGWIGLICTYFYNIFFGKKVVDENYRGLKWSRLAQKYAILSGFFAAVSTMFFLWASQKYDPSVIMVFSAIPCLYLAIYDVARHKTAWASLRLPMFFIIIGSILAARNKFSSIWQITWGAILLLFVCKSGADAFDKGFRKKGGEFTDTANFVFWRLFWLSLFGTVGVLLFTLAFGHLKELLSLRVLFWDALPWVLITMSFVFGHNTLYQMALKHEAVSKVSLVLSLQVVLGIPITLLGNKLWPDIFGDVSFGPLVWFIRCLGAITIIVGIVLLNRQQIIKERIKPKS